MSGLVIVGGGPAGLAAARAYRDSGGAGRVTLLSADEHPPYARPPLTKDYLRGESDADALPLASPEWYQEHRIDLRLRTRVEAVDRAARQVHLAGGARLDYRHLVLATGSSPTHLPVPGGDHPGVIYVRDRHSGERLRALTTSPRRVAVIGSGFIGCEVAASLAGVGIEVVLVTDEDVPHAARLGAQAGQQIASWLTGVGVELRTGHGVAGLEARTDGTTASVSWRVALSDGSTLDADDVVCGGGAQPNISLAAGAGLELRRGGVLADAGLRTIDPAVWVAGDIAHALNRAAGRHLRVEHWGEAETHGKIAGAGAAGGTRAWDSAPGFWSGIGERTLKYTAWGDGHDAAVMTGNPESWVVWYRQGSELCGVLTHNDDEAYDRGRHLLERRARFEEALPAP